MTSNHEYETPDEGTVDWHLPLNQNFDSIDTDVEVRDVESNLDAYTPSAGAKFLATDTGVRYLGDGQAWVKAPSQPMDRVVAPSRTTDPSDVSEGQMWYREDTDELRAKVGGEIVALASPQPEGSDVEPIWTMDFNDPAPEASKDYNDRHNATLKDQMKARGWDWVNNHMWHGLDYFDAENHPDKVYEGSHSLAFYYMEDERMGFDVRKDINLDEAWAQYYLKFEPGFDPYDKGFKGGKEWAEGGKLPGWMGHKACAGGGEGPCDGTDGWSARMKFLDPGVHGYSQRTSESGQILLAHYVYHADMSGDYGSTDTWTLNDAGLVNTGQWYELTLHCKMNDGNQRNGVLEGWVDPLDGSGPTKAYEKTNWRFNKSGGRDLNIGQWWHVSYFGGGWWSPKDQYAYTDNLRLYDKNPLPTADVE